MRTSEKIAQVIQRRLVEGRHVSEGGPGSGPQPGRGGKGGLGGSADVKAGDLERWKSKNRAAKVKVKQEINQLKKTGGSQGQLNRAQDRLQQLPTDRMLK